jgi:hypothetical protein
LYVHYVEKNLVEYFRLHQFGGVKIMRVQVYYAVLALLV